MLLRKLDTFIKININNNSRPHKPETLRSMSLLCVISSLREDPFHNTVASRGISYCLANLMSAAGSSTLRSQDNADVHAEVG